jgi:preprotein translocase subunit YajC
MDLIFPLLILLMIGLVFFSSRQRKKQEAQQQSLQNALSVGDVVVMTSGISGTVVDVDDERTIDLEIAPDVVTTWLRAAVRDKVADAATATAPAPVSDTAVAPASGGSGADADGRPTGGAPTDTVADPADTPSDANGSARP